MSRQVVRLPTGGRIDRAQPISFVFDGESYIGYAGDTLASALLANGVWTVGRSFKLHRRRGVYTAGVNEPNALVTLRSGARREPNTPATMVELYPGLVAESQNRWPSLSFDIMAVNRLGGPALAAGFYYKTFMGPAQKSWMWFEPFIRRAAGLGRATTARDPDRYERVNMHCDVLVAGSGPAGLAAALAAGRAGVRVIVAEQMGDLGGTLLDEPVGSAGDAWRLDVLGELKKLANVTLLPRTTVFGAYDHGVYGLLQRVNDHMAEPGEHDVRQRYIVVRTGRAVIATGAIERGIAFANNDLPGVMLASAARTYLHRHALKLGKRVVVFTTNDQAYDTATELHRAGSRVTIVDPRSEPGREAVARAERARVDVMSGKVVVKAKGGRKGVERIVVASFDAGHGTTEGTWSEIDCELVCVSGGYDPQVHLSSQRGVKPVWRQDIAAFVPGPAPEGQIHAGACRGIFHIAEAIRDGLIAGEQAVAAVAPHADTRAGTTAASSVRVPATLAETTTVAPILPLFDVLPPPGWPKGKRFVDLQNDVTSADVALANREGYASVEHLKRYTTLGMATDQGKIGNVIGLGILASEQQAKLAEAGTTTYRPPYTPVAIGAVAADAIGRHARPIRRTPLDLAHRAAGAVMIETGLWIRPWYYPQAGEDIDAAYRREALTVRDSVGMVDVSTLGKIDVQGPDATTFLERVYVNPIASLAVGRVRYGIMLRDDGIVLDDGTLTRIAPHHYFMTTTTAEAAKVLQHLEWLLSAAWPDLKVHVTSVTDQWGAIALAGPNAPALLGAVVTDGDISDAALPHMGVTRGRIGEASVRLLRVSYSGERGYEIYVPAGHAEAVWQRLAEAGRGHGLVYYGTEAMGALRIEKGHVAGAEIDGRTTLADLGLEKFASRKKAFVGKTLAGRPALLDPQRPKLVGLIPVDRARSVRPGSILQPHPGPHEGHGLGHVSSTTFSPQLGHHIALGLLAGGMAFPGQRVDACYPLRDEVVTVEVVSPHFYDPKGERLGG